MQPRLELKQNQSHAEAKTETSLRCACGSLLARMVAAGVEIKCRRCKRQVVLPFDAKGTMRMNL
jgi:hypothetical protein